MDRGHALVGDFPSTNYNAVLLAMFASAAFLFISLGMQSTQHDG